MTNTFLEHANITVSDAKASAARLRDLFDWKIRWEGDAMNGLGYTVHVGNDNCYLALYSANSGSAPSNETSYTTPGSLNHVGIVVEDIAAMEKRVSEAGYTPHNHQDYEPGKRFYFHDEDQIEYEVVSYT